MNAVSAKGVIHGKTVELDHDAGLPDGQAVTVLIQAEMPKSVASEALLRAFGGWADDAEGLDEFLAEMRRSRDADTSHREINE